MQLLVVIAMIGTLATTTLPALAQEKATPDRIVSEPCSRRCGDTGERQDRERWRVHFVDRWGVGRLVRCSKGY